MREFMKKLSVALVAMVIFSFAVSAVGAEAVKAPGAPQVGSQGPRKKSIEFEDGMVEGMNRRSRDSLDQIGEADLGKRKKHLYQLRGDFRDQMSELMGELGYLP